MMKVFLAFGLAAVMGSADAVEVQSFECEGCGALSSAGAKLRGVSKTDLRAHDVAQTAVGKAIGQLRRKMDGTWSADQVDSVLKALSGEPDHEYRQFVIAPNSVYFKDNRELIVQRSKRLPPGMAKDILFDIDAMIRTVEFGNNSPDPALKK